MRRHLENANPPPPCPALISTSRPGGGSLHLIAADTAACSPSGLAASLLRCLAQRQE